MNDRFKFRAWNKEDKKIHEAEGVYGYKDEYTQGGEVFLKGFKTSHYFPEQVELMQCTGLKDKNGKLIYEGDIIEFTDNVNINGSKTHIAKVEHREEFNAYMYHAECMGWYTINPSQNEIFKVKVIGNIYENEDLLKCENQ